MQSVKNIRYSLYQVRDFDSVLSWKFRFTFELITMSAADSPPNSDGYFIINVQYNSKFLRDEIKSWICEIGLRRTIAEVVVEGGWRLSQEGFKSGSSKPIQVWSSGTYYQLLVENINPSFAFDSKIWLILFHARLIWDGNWKGKIKDICSNYFKDARVNSHISNSFRFLWYLDDR